MKYNLVFSIIAHESIQCIEDLVKNICYFTSHIEKVLIVLHLNDLMFKEYLVHNTKKVLVNPIHYNKEAHTSFLLKAHLENFEFTDSKGISFEYFMLLASNCLFVKKISWPLNLVKSKMKGAQDLTEWHWPLFTKNTHIMSVFKTNSIDFFARTHEGAVYDYDTLYQVNNFIKVNKLLSDIESETCFEESILPSVEAYLKGFILEPFAKIFFENPKAMVSIENIKDVQANDKSHICIVKRVHRDINDPVRKFISQGKYTYTYMKRIRIANRYLFIKHSENVS